jgi:hypothetical protein
LGENQIFTGLYQHQDGHTSLGNITTKLVWEFGDARMRRLGELGFIFIGEAAQRSVPYAPTIVLMKVLG